MGVILLSTDFDIITNTHFEKSVNAYKVRQAQKNTDQTGQYLYLLFCFDLRW